MYFHTICSTLNKYISRLGTKQKKIHKDFNKNTSTLLIGILSLHATYKRIIQHFSLYKNTCLYTKGKYRNKFSN